MDILIKNMEMPKDDENLTIVIEADGSVWQKIGTSAYFCTCGEAIELPPHGRLIDADKLKKDNPSHMDADVPYVTEVTVEEIIDDAPTVLEANK